MNRFEMNLVSIVLDEVQQIRILEEPWLGDHEVVAKRASEKRREGPAGLVQVIAKPDANESELHGDMHGMNTFVANGVSRLAARGFHGHKRIEK